jgi:hypothetical protein
MSGNITWRTERRKLADLLPWSRNPRRINSSEAQRLAESFDQFGQVEALAIGPENEIYNGHQRLKVLAQTHGADYEVDVRVASRALTEKEREKLTVFLHRGAVGDWAWDMLSDWDMGELQEWGFSENDLRAHFDVAEQHIAKVDMIPSQWIIMIECVSEQHQLNLLQRFSEEGLQCKALIS